MWGDYIARVTIAALVYERTRSPLATATTLAVSLVPTFFGRSLVGPVVDRFPYKWVLIWSHLLRAACVLGLMWLALTRLGALAHVPRPLRARAGRRRVDGVQHGAAHRPLRGPSPLRPGRRPRGDVRAVQPGARPGRRWRAHRARSVPRRVCSSTCSPSSSPRSSSSSSCRCARSPGERGRGLRGFIRDLSTAAGDLARHPVLARLVTLSAVAEPRHRRAGGARHPDRGSATAGAACSWPPPSSVPSSASSSSDDVTCTSRTGRSCRWRC